MTVDLAVLIALATGLICGWLARWQWDTRRNWHPFEEDEFDRWDRS